MAGLVGFSMERLDPQAAASYVQAMLRRVSHTPDHQLHAVVVGPVAAGSVSRGPAIPSAHQPGRAPGWQAWSDGEIYVPGLPFADGATWLASQAAADPALGFLREIDGHYSAVLVDEAEQAIHLVSDRCGLRQLYWSVSDGRLLWSSEVKAFIDAPGFEPRFDLAALQPFLARDHHAGANTWMEGVRLLDPGTVLTWRRGEDQPRQRRYWTWQDVPALPRGEDEVVAEMGRLFRAAVASRLPDRERVGIPLSGGLDSRAILAAAGKPAPPTVTFGQRDSQDVATARGVARLAGSQHHIIDLQPGPDWLRDRVATTWLTDGHFNVRHVHVTPNQLGPIRSIYSASLSGFLGDALLGGSYMEGPEARDAVGTGGTRARLERRFLERGRRFIYEAGRTVTVAVENRLPFFANSLLELTIALPDDLRREGRAYHVMLLQEFPRYFRSIPWNSDPPIGAGVVGRMRHRAGQRLLRGRRRQFADVPAWFRAPETAAWIEGQLLGPDARLVRLVDRSELEEPLREHRGGRDRSNHIGALLTVETWLRMVARGGPA